MARKPIKTFAAFEQEQEDYMQDSQLYRDLIKSMKDRIIAGTKPAVPVDTLACNKYGKSLADVYNVLTSLGYTVEKNSMILYTVHLTYNEPTVDHDVMDIYSDLTGAHQMEVFKERYEEAYTTAQENIEHVISDYKSFGDVKRIINFGRWSSSTDFIGYVKDIIQDAGYVVVESKDPNKYEIVLPLKETQS